MNRLTGVLKSFYCAGRGIAFCLRHERDYAVLILTCALVIAMEIINTSVEVVIDKVSPRYNVFAMIGKDLAAGAVLFSAIGAIAVGVFMFWDIGTFVKIFEYFTADVIRPLILAATIIVSLIFIFRAKPRKLGNKRSKGNDKND